MLYGRETLEQFHKSLSSKIKVKYVHFYSKEEDTLPCNIA